MMTSSEARQIIHKRKEKKQIQYKEIATEVFLQLDKLNIIERTSKLSKNCIKLYRRKDERLCCESPEELGYCYILSDIRLSNDECIQVFRTLEEKFEEYDYRTSIYSYHYDKKLRISW